MITSQAHKLMKHVKKLMKRVNTTSVAKRFFKNNHKVLKY